MLVKLATLTWQTRIHFDMQKTKLWNGNTLVSRSWKDQRVLIISSTSKDLIWAENWSSSVCRASSWVLAYVLALDWVPHQGRWPSLCTPGASQRAEVEGMSVSADIRMRGEWSRGRHGPPLSTWRVCRPSTWCHLPHNPPSARRHHRPSPRSNQSSHEAETPRARHKSLRSVSHGLLGYQWLWVTPRELLMFLLTSARDASQ